MENKIISSRLITKITLKNVTSAAFVADFYVYIKQALFTWIEIMDF